MVLLVVLFQGSNCIFPCSHAQSWPRTRVDHPRLSNDGVASADEGSQRMPLASWELGLGLEINGFVAIFRRPRRDRR